MLQAMAELLPENRNSRIFYYKIIKNHILLKLFILPDRLTYVYRQQRVVFKEDTRK